MGRIIAELRPDLAQTSFGYDPEGNTIAVTPPGQPTHGMSYSPVNLLASYTPPTLPSGDTPTTYTHDLDRKLDLVQQPGRLIDYSYDSAGRLSTIAHPNGTITRTYNPTTYQYDDAGRLTAVLADGDLTESYAYDANGNRTSSLNADGVFNASVRFQCGEGQRQRSMRAPS